MDSSAEPPTTPKHAIYTYSILLFLEIDHVFYPTKSVQISIMKSTNPT